jgi:hypothetical protein
MGGPFEGNWRQSWQEAHIAGCRPRIYRPAEPADTDPCGEGRAGNQCGRSPTGNPTAVRPLSPTGSEGNRTYRERGCGASVRSEGNQGVRVMGERRYRASVVIKGQRNTRVAGFVVEHWPTLTQVNLGSLIQRIPTWLRPEGRLSPLYPCLPLQAP